MTYERPYRPLHLFFNPSNLEQVLLYKFFESSSVDAPQWRVLLCALPKDQLSCTKFPAFDEVRHGGLCREVRTRLTINDSKYVAHDATAEMPLRRFDTG